MGKKRKEVLDMELTLYKPRRHLVPFGRLFGSLLDEDFFDLFDRRALHQSHFSPAVDIKETEKEITFAAELPGLTEKDIHVELNDHTLILRGEKKMEDRKDEEQYKCYESFYGSFERSFRLPEEAKGDKVKAKLKNGVLEVSIPKEKKVKPKEIPISIN